MSGFSGIANTGVIPTSGPGKYVSPESLFAGSEYRASYERMAGRAGADGQESNFRVNKVRVEIFDLSDSKQRRAYEKLWASLLEKAGRMEVVVESSKDLVRRADGTSYWMKYVEYVEFSGSEPVSEGPGSKTSRNGRNVR